MNNKEYADLILKEVKHTKEEYEVMYPKRDDGIVVTRFAPSPTGFVHVGSLYSAFVANKFAHDKKGIIFLRIEDTDQKRSIENGVSLIIDDLKNFNIVFDEGMINDTEEIGKYGPYIQSKRGDIYRSFAKYLLENDMAYPCFCSEDELNEIRKEQENKKDRLGYYGKYAKCRNLTKEEVIEKINNKENYVIRLKSNGDFSKKIVINDLVKGSIEFPENDLDIVIIKSDGLPTYHFAHLVDDFLMRTTHVIRSDEWVSSLPIHYQLFQVFNVKLPKYAHISPLLKKEDNAIRKISKRKDPEAAVSYYHKEGIPVEAVKLYLMTIANTNFEEWYNCNCNKTINDFEFSFKKVSTAGSLFDMDKLLNISKNYLSRLTKEEIFNLLDVYTLEFDKEFNKIINEFKDYTLNILNIEREQKKPRKDYDTIKNIKDQISYMYDSLFDIDNYKDVEIKDYYNTNILNNYINNCYSESDDKDIWYEKIKNLACTYHFAKEVKEYKENPDKYIGHVGDICELIRVAVTSKSQTPDLYEILKILGKERIKNRINIFNNYLKNDIIN